MNARPAQNEPYDLLKPSLFVENRRFFVHKSQKTPARIETCRYFRISGKQDESLSIVVQTTGGRKEGIDAIWVIKDGIHNDDVEANGNGSLTEGCQAVLDEFNQKEGTYANGQILRPALVLPNFRW